MLAEHNRIDVNMYIMYGSWSALTFTEQADIMNNAATSLDVLPAGAQMLVFSKWVMSVYTSEL